MRTGFLLAICLALPIISLGQPPAYPYSRPAYPFIRYDLNHLSLYGDSAAFELFYDKLDSLVFRGQGRVNIVHFGGSHVQGGTFPLQVMERFQTFHPGVQGPRGFLFPYAAASTNTPRGYSTEHTGDWEAVRNVDKDRVVPLGMSGIRISTTDTMASFRLLLNRSSVQPYLSETITLFTDTGASYRLVPDDSLASLVSENLGTSVYRVRIHGDTLGFHIEQVDTLRKPLHFYGLVAGNSEPGVSYHAFGINGATIAAFHQCEMLGSQLGLLDADLVILSLGINDAYGRRFSSDRFRAQYDTLIGIIRKVAPDAAILLTTNNDSYLHRRYVNRNGLLVRDAMQTIAESHDAAVWDMFTVMGGLSSINLWYAEGLANRDKVHLTTPGYSLIGNLLFEAILQSYVNHLKGEFNEEARL